MNVLYQTHVVRVDSIHLHEWAFNDGNEQVSSAHVSVSAAAQLQLGARAMRELASKFT